MKKALIAAFANGWAWSGLFPVALLAFDHRYGLAMLGAWLVLFLAQLQMKLELEVDLLRAYVRSINLETLLRDGALMQAAQVSQEDLDRWNQMLQREVSQGKQERDDRESRWRGER